MLHGHSRHGGLEYAPVLNPNSRSKKIDVDALVQLASDVLTQRQNLAGHFHDAGRDQALADLRRGGTSAAGARAKAAIAKRPRPAMCQLNLMSLRTRKTHPRRKYALP